MCTCYITDFVVPTESDRNFQGVDQKKYPEKKENT